MDIICASQIPIC